MFGNLGNIKSVKLTFLISSIIIVFNNDKLALCQRSRQSRIVDQAVVVPSSASSSACKCMDYWDCVGRNGEIYSYCGISDSEVCCFMNEPVFSILKIGSADVNLLSDPEVVTPEIEEGFTSDSPSIVPKLSSSSIESSTTTVTEDIFKCGQPSVSPKLDSKAKFAEWPWHVAILEVTEDLYICGGALVSPNRIITAAHCLTAYKETVPKQAPKLKIRAGEYDVSGNHELEPHVEVLVDMIAIHPKFNNASLDNDIAILGLSRSINYTLNIQPLCLPSTADRRRNRRILSQKQCVVTGWGRSSEKSNHSIVLKEIVAPLWSNNDCQQRLQKNFGSNYKLPSTSLCAGDQGKDAAICDGDGGGPLACLHEGKWYHEGIVSFGIGCGLVDSPGVYTRVASFLGFVLSYLS